MPHGAELPDVAVLAPVVVTPTVVVAAVIERDGRFLVTERQRGVHLEGLWEFPGGKLRLDETAAAGLARELKEELAVDARVGEEILATTHAYADRSIELHFLRCELMGEPQPQLGQRMLWASADDLRRLPFPAADGKLIDLLTHAR